MDTDTTPALELVEETVSKLWSVRTRAGVYLVVQVEAHPESPYDVHLVADGGVEYVDQVFSMNRALEVIRRELDAS